MSEKMSRGKIIFLIVFFVAAVFLFIFQRVNWPHMTVELKDQRLNVLVAKNIYQQRKGLGGRDSLAPYDGMLFPYSLLGKPTMVMRDMEFSIDIVWFLDGEVVDFAPQVAIEPDREEYEYTKYYPRTEANLVLELPGGWSDEYDLRIGDKIRIVEE
ncbi:hypothetical protein C0581_01850 [Candidatus Parcubacteria bacterium]|nr:MAG: hypothetical protein C0581_01850 [Candidatus Parcubacteria bacterium]